MSESRLDPRRVLIFRRVLRAGSISAGARELGWTQPAVSQHLQALEREAGTALLVRGARGVEPTEAGTALLAHADAVAAHLDAAVDEVGDLAQARRGTVRLAAFPSGSAVLVPQGLARLARSTPGVDVRLTEAEPPEALDLVREGAVDLALVFGYEEQERAAGRDALVHVPLVEDPVRLVQPGGAPVVTELADLADAAWVAGCERCRAHLLACCEAAGFTPRIRHVTDDYVVVQSLVALGLAVAVLPGTALAAFRHPEVQVGDAAGLGSRRIDLVHRRGLERVPAVAALVAALAAAAAADRAADSGA